jgi:hypothetical protein
VGDWVHSHESGIWQIYRVLHYKHKDPVTKLEQQKASIFSKRFLPNSFKRSFKAESCDPSFVRKLDEKTFKKLNEFIEENDKLYELFVQYKPEPIDSIYNAGICIPEGKSIKDVQPDLSNTRSVNVFEIDEYLQSLGFETEGLLYWTAQFVSENHICEDGYLVYRFERVLDF